MCQPYKLLLIICITLNANAQVNRGAPRVTALGNTGASLQGVYALAANQAGIAKLKKAALAAMYVEHFIGSEIRSHAGMALVPGRLGVMGMYVGKYGLQDAYSELKAGLSYARMFGPRLAMALTMNYHQLKIPKYGLNNTFSAEVGIQYFFNERWTIGGHFANPGNFSFNNEAYAEIPVRVQLGTNYRFSDQVLICVDGKYSFHDKGVDGSMGLEYKLIEWFVLRGGISVNHFKQYTGFGFSYHQLSFDAAATIHPRLGISPQVALCYAF